MAKRSQSRSEQRRKRRQQRRGGSGRMVSPWTLAGLAVILVGVAGFLFAYTRSLPGPAAQTRASNQQGDIPFPEVPRIPLEEAKAKFDAGTALIVDTRSREEYDQSHIPNAISLPLTELNTQNPDLPRDVEIITYCT